MSDYEQYLLQQQAEQSPRHNDMTLDERMTEYIEWQNTDFDRDLMVDANLEIIKLRRERDGLVVALAAAREFLAEIEFRVNSHYPIESIKETARQINDHLLDVGYRK